MTDSNAELARSHYVREQGSRVLGILFRAILPLAILIAGVAAYLWLSVEVEKEKIPPVAKQTLRTQVAEMRVRDYPIVIQTNGVIQPHNQVALSSQVAGQVTVINPAFEAGSYFNKGEVLIEVDSHDYKTALAIAEAQLLGAKSAVELAVQDHQRKLSLLRKNSVSPAEVSLAAATRAQAAAQVDSLTAQLEQANRDLERTQVRAPFDGRVRTKEVGIGQSVAPGSVLGVVFAVDFAEVRLPIAGRELQFLELPELSDDNPVEVELRDAINKASPHSWKASIVRAEGALDENSLELIAIARVYDPFGRESGLPPLRMGQPVVASIVGKTLTDVVAIPRNAVRQLDQVYLVDKNELTITAETIEPLWSDEEYVIVRDPMMKDGGLVSTTHLVYVPDGAKVEIMQDVELATATLNSNSDDKDKPAAN